MSSLQAIDTVAERVIKRWRFSPLYFVKECIGATPSSQQAEALKAVGSLARAKMGVGHEKGKKALARKLGVSIRSGHGCHAAGTPILMYDGSVKPVEEIEIGDLLMGPDGLPRTVISLARGIEPMYRIRYADGSYYDVNESHILALVATQSHGKQRTGDVTFITVRDYLRKSERWQRTNIGFKTGVEFPKKELKIPPYILGLWLGDGGTGRTTLYNIDPEIIAKWREYGEELGLRYVQRIVKEHHLYGTKGAKERFGVVNPLKTWLRELGVLDNKHIPFEYKTSSMEDRLQLLAGLLDTDGCLDTRHKTAFDFISKNEQLAKDVVFLCQSCGIHASLRQCTKTWRWAGTLNSDTYYRVYINRNTHLIPTLVSRKQAVPNKQRKNLHFNFTIEPLGEGEYYGFSLLEDPLYLLGDFTVTHNTGKDALASWLILWMLTCYPYPKILVTAPSAPQLRAVLWGELKKWIRHSAQFHGGKSILSENLVWQTDKIYMKDAKEEWFAICRTANLRESGEDPAEALAGMHAKYLMFVADEASGIPDGAFAPLEGSMTGKLNFGFLIGQMTRREGYFYRTHFGPDRERWICLHWNSEESELVEKEWVEDKLRRYGRDSNYYKVRVLGEPPGLEPDTLIPFELIEAAVERDIEPGDAPLVLGVDVARMGDDKSVIVARRGNVIEDIRKYQKLDLHELEGWIRIAIQELKPAAVYIDVIGYGAKIVDDLRADGFNVTGVNVAEKAARSDRFHRLRDELWWKLREAFEERKISIPKDEELIGELATIKWKPEGGKVKVESKQEMRKRGLKSPDTADALCLTYYRDDRAYALHFYRRNLPREAVVDYDVFAYA